MSNILIDCHIIYANCAPGRCAPLCSPGVLSAPLLWCSLLPWCGAFCFPIVVLSAPLVWCFLLPYCGALCSWCAPLCSRLCPVLPSAHAAITLGPCCPHPRPLLPSLRWVVPCRSVYSYFPIWFSSCPLFVYHVACVSLPHKTASTTPYISVTPYNGYNVSSSIWYWEL